MIAQEMITQSGHKSDCCGSKPGRRTVRGQARILLTSNRGYDRVRFVLAGLSRPLIFVVSANDLEPRWLRRGDNITPKTPPARTKANNQEPNDTQQPTTARFWQALPDSGPFLSPNRATGRATVMELGHSGGFHSWFRGLSAFTVLATFSLVILGGVVRVTESGLGCPDWPGCDGGIFPPLETKALIEYSHRITASFLVGPLILFLFRTRTVPGSVFSKNSGGSTSTRSRTETERTKMDGVYGNKESCLRPWSTTIAPTRLSRQMLARTIAATSVVLMWSLVRNCGRLMPNLRGR